MRFSSLSFSTRSTFLSSYWSGKFFCGLFLSIAIQRFVRHSNVWLIWADYQYFCAPFTRIVPRPVYTALDDCKYCASDWPRQFVFNIIGVRALVLSIGTSDIRLLLALDQYLIQGRHFPTNPMYVSYKHAWIPQRCESVFPRLGVILNFTLEACPRQCFSMPSMVRHTTHVVRSIVMKIYGWIPA